MGFSEDEDDKSIAQQPSARRSSSAPKKKSKKGKKKGNSCGFETLGLSSEVFRGIKRKGYQVPTPIQRKTLPLILAGHDVVAMARTGSGKTAAFLIPLIERLRSHSSSAGARAVVLSPTRELALQTFAFANELGRFTDLRSAVLVGGDSMESQFEALASNPDILIATPGRLMHHLSEVEGMSLQAVEFVVFDEADRLFEMGFASQLREITKRMSDSRQTLLFSATLPKMLAEFARAGLRDPHLIRLDTDTKISPDLKLEFFTVRPDEKIAALLHLVREVVPGDQQTIIFVATKHHVEFLHEILKAEGIDSSMVYGALDQTARKIHLAKFRAQKTKFLVVTDVAARGLDIPLLDNVVNFDFPPKPKLFVHRGGRAARAGRTGSAFSFLTQEELPYLLDLHLFLSRPVKPTPTEDDIVTGGEMRLAEAEAAVARGETLYGRLPQPLVDAQMERLRQLLAENVAISMLQKVCAKALKLYLKTRPPPSSESLKRSKLLPPEGIHLGLRAAVSSTEAAAAAFAEHLRSYRPRQTVLEAEADAAKGRSSKKAATVTVEVMKRKREQHSEVIVRSKQQRQRRDAEREESQRQSEREVSHALEFESQQQQQQQQQLDKRKAGSSTSGSKRAGEESGAAPPPSKRRMTTRVKPQSFRDDENFITATPPNQLAEKAFAVGSRGGGLADARRMEAEVLDLVPEDGEGVKQRRATYRWDKKSKKYVKLHAGETMTASGKIKTESGVKVNVNSRGIYKRWKEKTHKAVATVGEEAEGDEGGSGSGRGNKKWGGRGNMKGRGMQSRHGGSDGDRGRPKGGKNELRDMEQIRKERQKTEFKKSLAKSKGRGKGGPQKGGGSKAGGAQRGGGTKSGGTRKGLKLGAGKGNKPQGKKSGGTLKKGGFKGKKK